MRPVFFLLLALTLSPNPGACAAQVSGESSASTAPDPEGGEVEMTAMVRRALHAPEAPESWAGLAQALSAMGSQTPGGQRPAGVMAAVRIADSLAFAPLLARNEEPKAETARAVDLLQSIPRNLGGLLPLGAAVAALLGLVATGWLPGKGIRRRLAVGKKGRGPGSSIRRAPAWAGGSDRIPQDRARERTDARSMALSLLEHGMPANEVARRTGLAQDELAVVLALSRQQQRSSGKDSLFREDFPLPGSA